VSLGYANEGVHEPHEHTRVTEIYLVASGAARARVERADVELAPGDILVIEPGEAHSFLWSSVDYRHFVVHVPGLEGDDAVADKLLVPRERLGL